MSLPNLLKNLFDQLKQKIPNEKKWSFSLFRKAVKEDGSYFFHRNKKEILVILGSLLILSGCTWLIVSSIIGLHRRTALQKEKIKKDGITKTVKNEKQQPKEKQFPIENKALSVNENWNKDLLFLLNGIPDIPESATEEFSGDYIQLFPLNNYNRTDINLVIKVYDKMIDNSIEESCTFTFERRRK